MAGCRVLSIRTPFAPTLGSAFLQVDFIARGRVQVQRGLIFPHNFGPVAVVRGCIWVEQTCSFPELGVGSTPPEWQGCTDSYEEKYKWMLSRKLSGCLLFHLSDPRKSFVLVRRDWAAVVSLYKMTLNLYINLNLFIRHLTTTPPTHTQFEVAYKAS